MLRRPTRRAVVASSPAAAGGPRRASRVPGALPDGLSWTAVLERSQSQSVHDADNSGNTFVRVSLT